MMSKFLTSSLKRSVSFKPINKINRFNYNSFRKMSNNVNNFYEKKTLSYGDGIPSEIVFGRNESTMKQIPSILSGEKCAVLGYGPQGQGQALNLRDSGVEVCIGVRKDGSSWLKAIDDGFIPGETLFPIEEAVEKGSIIMFLLSDAGQIDIYPQIRDKLDNKNKTLYFSHGFGVVYQEKTQIDVDNLKNTDVIMIAPKGSGKSVRTLYQKGSGINASYAVHRDDSGNAENKALAIGFGIGSPYIYETTFLKEVSSDLTGERSVLMGGIAGLFKAQYDVLRENGHSPSEAFNETVEEALQSLYPLINEKGMDYMFSNCSTTAQRGALDWSKRFEALNKPLIEEIYKSVVTGKEAERTIDCNSSADYRKNLNEELDEVNNMEIWKVGKEIRKLRY